MSLEQKRAFFKQLVGKEVEILRIIDTLKKEAQQESQQLKITLSLLRREEPLKLTLSNNDQIEVVRPENLKAVMLNGLYKELEQSMSDRKAGSLVRLDVLGKVKTTIGESSKTKHSELSSLIERERVLLKRNSPLENLGGLRLRILKLFLEFIKTA